MGFMALGLKDHKKVRKYGISQISTAQKKLEVGIFLTILGVINLIVLPNMYSLFSIITVGPLLIWVIVKTDKFIS